MGLADTQKLVERSIFEAIRKKLVSEGYLPDITLFPNTEIGYGNFQSAVQAIRSVKGFATEIFGHGSSQSKELKRVPRIAIVTRRVFPGDIGGIVDSEYITNPLDPNNIMEVKPDNQTADIQLDIHLVSNSAEQDRFLGAILAAVIGSRRYLPIYTDTTQKIFARQYNYYDLPDTMEGIIEKVYSYEIKDLWLFGGDTIRTSVPLIKEITINTTLLELESIVNSQGIVIGPYVTDSSMVIDLSGITF